MDTKNDTTKPERDEQPEASALSASPGSDGEERDILVTVYIYEVYSPEATVDVGNVMRDLDCSFYAPCELVMRHFSLGTDAYATDEKCAEHFVNALKKSGVSVCKYEISSLPNNEDRHEVRNERS